MKQLAMIALLACACAEDGVVQISKEHVVREFGDAEALAKAITMTPHFEGERMDGFLLVEVHRGSVADAIGLKTGDVVVRIAGIDLDAPEKPFQVHARLKDQRQAEVTVKRNGALKTFTVRVVD